MKKGFKECPYCKNYIKKEAIKCMYCKEMLPEEKPETKECPFCKNEIKYEAIKCQYCNEMLNNNKGENLISYLKGIGSKIKEKLPKKNKKLIVQIVEEKKIEKKEKINEEKKAFDEKKNIKIEKVEENVKREYSGEKIKFKSRTWIYIYFMLLSAIIAGYLYISKSIGGCIIFLAIVFLELGLYIMRKRNYIKTEKDYFEISEYLGNPIKPEIAKIKYEDIKIINFKNSNWPYRIWYFIIGGAATYNSKTHSFTEDLDINAVIIFIIIFIFHTIPLIIFRNNCSNIEIETKDGKVALPKIAGKKELMNILEEAKIKYTY